MGKGREQELFVGDVSLFAIDSRHSKAMHLHSNCFWYFSYLSFPPSSRNFRFATIWENIFSRLQQQLLVEQRIMFPIQDNGEGNIFVVVRCRIIIVSIFVQLVEKCFPVCSGTSETKTKRRKHEKFFQKRKAKRVEKLTLLNDEFPSGLCKQRVKVEKVAK